MSPPPADLDPASPDRSTAAGPAPAVPSSGRPVIADDPPSGPSPWPLIADERSGPWLSATADLPEAALLHPRRAFVSQRVAALRARIAEIAELAEVPDLCLYLTGSYGRFEASPYSDLDIFFMHKGTFQHNALLPVQKTLIDAALIRGCRDLGFPELTGGGQYLRIHYLDDIRSSLGGPQDDAQNFFTARMLLLLESLPLYNDALYRDVIRAMISSYYRDYSDHEKNFRPIFFQNDIMRYWKTMCLNYEYRRNRLPDDPIKHAEFHLKNFRLKFSRLLTCFSMIIAVVHLSRRAVLRDSELLALVLASPWQRLIEVARDTGSRSLLGQMVDLYVWFLDSTAAPKEQCARWIADRATRNQAFGRASEFGGLLFTLLQRVAEGTDALRYLVM